MIRKILATAASLMIGSTAAFAHITLEVREAPVGSTYKAVLRVGHGCEGKPTNTVRVQVPEGFYGVKPQPKAGWKLEKIVGKYDKPFDNGHTKVTEGIKEIIWSGGSLADDEYDEFVLRGSIAKDLKAGDTLYFPVVQECPDGAKGRWIEIPTGNQKSDDLEMPAPGLKLTGTK